MTGPIVIINPNSNTSVTDGLDAAMAPFRFSGGPAIECVTLNDDTFGIESQLDSGSVILPLAAFVRSRPDAGAFVVFCYFDPGVDVCRSVISKTVLGIQEWH